MYYNIILIIIAYYVYIIWLKLLQVSIFFLNKLTTMKMNYEWYETVKKEYENKICLQHGYKDIDILLLKKD